MDGESKTRTNGDFRMTQVLIDRAALELVLRTLNRLRYDNDSAMAEDLE